LKNLEVKDLGLVEYEDVWQQMQVVISQMSGNEPDELWFAEHYPVYTLGHAAEEKNIISKKDIPVVRTDRGGQVTYHGPGQLMIYFLLNLRRLGWGPKKLICELEEVMINLLSKYGVNAKRRIGAPGIYVQGKKIASIGLKIKKGHCYHGISFNIDMDLKPFDGIVTCGIDSLEVTQLKDLENISMDKIKQDLVNMLKEHYSQAA
jgi:lipoyl(octanoyl) transferase